MKYKLSQTNQFKKELALAQKRGKNLKEMNKVVDMLQAGQPLPEKYKDHKLGGGYEGCRECHIKPDWLLVYMICEDTLILLLVRTGSHSDLF